MDIDKEGGAVATSDLRDGDGPSAMPIGEYDKRLVILTRKQEKYQFLPKAPEDNSALLACRQPFAFGEFSLYAGRSFLMLRQRLKNYFEEL
jgi:DNA repair protein RecO (recombination protein O)